MNWKKLEEKQKKILESVYDCEGYATEGLGEHNILSTLRLHKEADIQFSLGAIGRSILNFSREIDTFHPDLSNVLDGELISNEVGSFSRVAMDVMKLGFFACNNHMSYHMVEGIKSVLFNHEKYEIAKSLIECPSSNRRHIRLVFDNSLRESLRSDRCFNILPDKHTWNRDICDFDNYLKFASPYSEDLEKAKKELSHFKNMNLSTLSSDIENSIDKMERKMRQYYGFNRIPLDQAASILAKINGCKRSLEDFSNSKKIRLYVSNEDIDVCDFCKCNDEFEIFKFEPVIYSYNSQKEKAPKRIVDVVKYLDAYPEIGGRVLFDNYHVLAPSLQCLESNDELLKSKDVLSILLGERDGEHYFICYWM